VANGRQATRPSYVPRLMTPAQAAERAERERQTRAAVIAMARRRAHGEEIEAYLYERAPLLVDPEHYIRALLTEKAVYAHQCEPTPRQLVGIDPLWGRRVGHPFHHRFYAPPFVERLRAVLRGEAGP
jgi:hypothetical protein